MCIYTRAKAKVKAIFVTAGVAVVKKTRIGSNVTFTFALV